jgi:excisionase family DNA binding protein
VEKIALTIIEACQAAGVSRTSLYAAIGRGELAARKRGRRTLVLVDDLKTWVSQLPRLAALATNEAQLKSGQATYYCAGGSDVAVARAEVEQFLSAPPQAEKGVRNAAP